MKPSIFKVTKILNGELYIMPRPSADWLADDMEYFSELGINELVSLLEPQEASYLGLETEGEACRDKGLAFTNFPIPDRGLPTTVYFKQLVEDVYSRLAEGSNIAIHCRAGIGRTGVLACSLIMRNGLPARDAIDLVSEARGFPIPDTAEQYDFIMEFQVDS